MKNILYRIFIWFAGADKALLDRCTTLERIKYAMYGALIWIPTIAAVVAMRYALSTFVANDYIITLLYPTKKLAGYKKT